MKVVILPMDNRPPNYRFLIDLAAMYDLKIVLPPSNKLGFYMKSGDVLWLLDWLLRQNGEAFLISSEMLCYGGLVASREFSVSLHEALKRLETLSLIKRKAPHASIWVSSVIRRASVTVNSIKTEFLWSKFNQYLKASESERTKIAESLNKDYLKRYWQLRKRNHEINKACIELVALGIIDLLVLAIEDTFPNGPHESELIAINQKIADLNVQDKVYVHNGADEVMQELLVRLFNRGGIEIHFDSEETMFRVMDFEHQPFVRNVYSHVSLSGFTVKDNSAAVLLIVGSNRKKGLEMLKQLVSNGKQVYLLDVFHSNGADETFIADLFDILENSSNILIKGFSAWNTASNRLGTLLAEAAMSEKKDEFLLLKFMLERFIDDYLYQSIYRARLEKILLTYGENKYFIELDSKAMKLFLSEFEIAANKMLKSFEGKIFYVGYKPWILKSARITSFELPWRRTFECDVTVRISAESLSCESKVL